MSVVQRSHLVPGAERVPGQRHACVADLRLRQVVRAGQQGGRRHRPGDGHPVGDRVARLRLVPDQDLPPVGGWLVRSVDARAWGDAASQRHLERVPPRIAEADRGGVQRGLDGQRLAGAAAVVRQQELTGVEALDRRDGRRRVEPAEHVPGRQQHHGRREAVPAEMRALPGVPAADGGQRVRDRAAADGTAQVAFAVCADQGQPLGSRAGGAGRDVGRQVEGAQVLRPVPGPPPDTLRPLTGVGERPSTGLAGTGHSGTGHSGGEPAGSADQQHVQVGVGGRPREPPGRARVDVPLVKGGLAPRSRYLEQEVPAVGDGGRGDRLAPRLSRIRAAGERGLRRECGHRFPGCRVVAFCGIPGGIPGSAVGDGRQADISYHHCPIRSKRRLIDNAAWRQRAQAYKKSVTFLEKHAAPPRKCRAGNPCRRSRQENESDGYGASGDGRANRRVSWPRRYITGVIHSRVRLLVPRIASRPADTASSRLRPRARAG